jgi:hypothetical protein
MACPHCHQLAPTNPVGFTWWGGLVGPRLLSHVQCAACGGRYNGRTGKLNTTAIGIYLGVAAALLLVVLVATVLRTQMLSLR